MHAIGSHYTRVMQVKGLLAPRIPFFQLKARRRCATRLIDYLKLAVQRGQAASSIVEFQRRVVLIQRTWRGLAAIRGAQRELLFRQLSKQEGLLIKANRRRCAHDVQGSKPAGHACTSRALCPCKQSTAACHAADPRQIASVACMHV